MITSWDELDYWRSGEWQFVQEKLDDFDRAGVLYNPPRHRLFAAMDALPITDVRVCIIGQDPYPGRAHATGIAFSIPEDIDDFPPTLLNIFDELVNDLKIEMPEHGNLMDWVKQGVFLWNATPSCETGKPGSHAWSEWDDLTREIVLKLQDIAGVFVFLGAHARKFAKLITKEGVVVIETSHPSPLGYKAGKTPFQGSRLFSTINANLVEPIDWRL